MMTIRLLLAGLLLSIGGWCKAQNIDPQEMADYQTNTMTEYLNLSKDQVDSVKEINLKYSKKQSVLMNREGSMFSKMSEMKKISEDKKGELEKVLSNQQLRKYEEDVEPLMRKEMRKRMQQGS